MKRFSKPNVVVSRCLGFDRCRYNGQIISSEVVKDLRGHVDFITVCPEVDIGLGIPRDSLRIVQKDGQRRLIQPASGNDHTDEMNEFISHFLDMDEEIDGFILKGGSPSCGINDVKIYPKKEQSAPIERGSGLFGEDVLAHFPEKAVETEGRLRNYQIREHFLTKIFTFADFRERSSDLNSLEEFHEENELLFRSYDRDLYGKMTELIDGEDTAGLYGEYGDLLYDMFRRPPPCESKVRMMKDVLEDLSVEINEDEKDFFMETIERYIDGKSSMDVPLSILITWLIRYGKKEMTSQSFFYPYPKDLVKLEDIKTCQARDYWPF